MTVIFNMPTDSTEKIETLKDFLKKYPKPVLLFMTAPEFATYEKTEIPVWKKCAAGIYALISIGSCVPVIAVLTTESTAEAFVRKPQTFLEIMQSDEWLAKIIGVAGGGIGTLSVLFFTMKYSYLFIKNFSFHNHGLFSIIGRLLLEAGVFLPSGGLNGETTYHSWLSCGVPDSALVQIVSVALGLTPGFSNGESLRFFYKFMRRDMRYVRRLFHESIAKIRYGHEEERLPVYEKELKKVIMQKLSGIFDDITLLSEYSIGGRELRKLLLAVGNEQNPNDRVVKLFAEFSKSRLNRSKVVAGDGFGSVVALIVATVGNYNNVEYGYQLFNRMFSNIVDNYLSFIPKLLVEGSAFTLAWIGFLVNVLMWFYLLRNMIFRPMLRFHLQDHKIIRLMATALLLVPAFFLGFANLIVVALNSSLSPALAYPVAIFSILGNGVLSLGGLTNEINALLGIKDMQAYLMQLGDDLKNYVESLESGEVITLWHRIEEDTMIETSVDEKDASSGDEMSLLQSSA